MTGPDIGCEDEALEVCQGVVLGRCRADRLHFEVLEYLEDRRSELDSRAVELWHSGRRPRSNMISSSNTRRMWIGIKAALVYSLLLGPLGT